jgi:hypothetical protein
VCCSYYFRERKVSGVDVPLFVPEVNIKARLLKGGLE